MSQSRARSWMALAGGAALVAVLLLLSARPGTGQDQTAKPAGAYQNWTAESHDRTNFPLVGKHRTVSCRECHLNLVFEGTPKDCEYCHWIRRQDDRYSLRLGTRCSDCHTPQSWKKVDPALWSHEVNVGYRLEGVHKTLDCESCHGSAGFANRPTACYGCHAADYQGTRDPNHAEAGFPTDCTRCHSQRSWSDASFDHTGFVLQGRHRTASCSECHPNGVFQGTSPLCVSCHLADYNGTTDPNHRASGFPTDCANCHGTSATSWSDATFDHTGFALQGRHATATCAQCHPNGVFQGTSTQCVSCHLAAYNATTDPNHRNAGFPTDCANCHGTSASSWSGATFTHTGFTLRGLHATAACSQCHPNGVYQGTSTACVSCHLADYNGTTDPNHRNAGFPTDCANCHGTSATSWAGAVFNHPFPIASGRHAVACSECHQTSDYRVFNCLGCHDKSSTDSRHTGVTGYQYSSAACYACHPNGTGGPAGR